MTAEVLERIRSTRTAVEDFLYEEAARADAHDYAGWLELWAEDGSYYAPANYDGGDGRLQVALVNEDYSGLCERVRVQQDGFVHAQSPRHRLARTISNVRVRGRGDGLVEARAVFDITAFRRDVFDFFAGHVVFHLRPVDDGFRIVRKEVHLINSDGFLPNMTFLL